MARVLTLTSTALQTVSWVVDRDCDVVGFSAPGVCSFSRDPNTTSAAPAVGTPDANLIAFTDSKFTYKNFPPVTLYQGESVYIGFPSASYASIYLVDRQAT